MLTLTAPHKTIFHSVPAGRKLLGLCVVSTALFQISSLSILLALTFGVAVTYLTQGMGFAKFGARMLRPLWPFVVIIALYHWVTHDFGNGVEIILRMMIAVALANLVTMTTSGFNTQNVSLGNPSASNAPSRSVIGSLMASHVS